MEPSGQENSQNSDKTTDGIKGQGEQTPVTSYGFDLQSNSSTLKVPNKNPKPPSERDDISVAASDLVLRPHHDGDRKRIVSSIVVPSRTNLNPKRPSSASDSSTVQKYGTKKNNAENFVLRLVLPEGHLNNFENNRYVTPNVPDNNTGNLLPNGQHQQQTYSICSQHEYPTPNKTGNINHAYPVGDFEYPSPITPGGFAVGLSPAPSNYVPDDPSTHDEKKRAFIDILTKTLSVFYALFNVTVGLAVYVADFIDGSHPTAEIFSLILVVVAAMYIIYLTVDISIFMYRKREYEKIIEKNMPEEVEMTKMADGNYQFNIVLPEIIKMGKSIKHNYCFNKDRHSTNFYLKVGAAAFCLGHLTHSGLLLGYQMVFLSADDNKFYQCASVTTLILDFIYPFYSLLLLFFMFKYSNVIINGNIVLARFGIMHCLSSSLCFWVWTIFREVLEAIAAKSDAYDTNTVPTENVSYSPYASPVTPYNQIGAPISSEPFNFSVRRFTSICDYEDESIKNIYRDISPYLYPFSVEYSILVVGVLYLVWQNIGMCKVADENEASTSQCRTAEGSPENMESNVVVHVDCQASNKGLFAGFVVLIITIVCCILYFIAVYFDNGKSAEMGRTTYIVGLLIILALMVFASAVGYRQMTKLDLNSAHHNLLDDFLLFICIPAFFLNGIFSIIPAIIYNNALGYVTPIVEIFQVLIQTVFILDGLRRSSNTKKLKKKKPGRELVTFLIITNIALWLMQTFEVKAHGLQDNRYDYYGKELWTILGHVCLPLMMFYRFHSSVCFGDIWKYAYERSGH